MILCRLLGRVGCGTLVRHGRLGTDAELSANPVVNSVHLCKRRLELPLILQVQPALIGYGAAPILGFGLALGVLASQPRTEAIRV